MADGTARVVVGVTGATGAIYAVRLLERLRRAGCETHLVATPAGLLNVHHELGLDRKALEALADVAYNPADIGAAIASGSFAAQAMVVAPCSMKSLAAIANGLSDNLLDARRRRRPEGAAPAAPDGARDAASTSPTCAT